MEKAGGVAVKLKAQRKNRFRQGKDIEDENHLAESFGAEEDAKNPESDNEVICQDRVDATNDEIEGGSDADDAKRPKFLANDIEGLAKEATPFLSKETKLKFSAAAPIVISDGEEEIDGIRKTNDWNKRKNSKKRFMNEEADSRTQKRERFSGKTIRDESTDSESDNGQPRHRKKMSDDNKYSDGEKRKSEQPVMSSTTSSSSSSSSSSLSSLKCDSLRQKNTNSGPSSKRPHPIENDPRFEQENPSARFLVFQIRFNGINRGPADDAKSETWDDGLALLNIFDTMKDAKEWIQSYLVRNGLDPTQRIQYDTDNVPYEYLIRGVPYKCAKYPPDEPYFNEKF